MVAIGDIFEGTVTGVMAFGAFVEFDDNQSGMVHISEISETYVKDINDHIKKGDKVKVKVIKIEDNGKISLSIKRVNPPKTERVKKEAVKKTGSVRPDDFDWSKKSDDNMSFEDKLSKFKQISDENMQAVRRSAEGKRSGGYSRKGNY